MRTFALGAIRLYQLAISPYWPGRCRHEPTCSRYAQEAINKHGVARGIRLALGRLGRCRPFGTSGYDPVP
ncbi:MAG: membrane protein insertion efficiency factor YidD [Chloroflexi bacterium]|nr:membrane protein insertion efficiency factor YidD [Chloroflexota bacterium]